jgi:hypothetical protein
MRNSRLKCLKVVENGEKVQKERGGGEETNSTKEWACQKKDLKGLWSLVSKSGLSDILSISFTEILSLFYW